MNRLFSDLNHYDLLLILDLCIPDEGYSRNSLCALDFDIYVFITARRDSFSFRRDSLLLMLYIYVTQEYLYYLQTQTVTGILVGVCYVALFSRFYFSAWSLVNSSYVFYISIF